MYPFKEPLETTMLQNKWYVVATTSELGDKPVARRILDRPVAIFRGDEGVSVVDGLCPHRGYPLGESTVVDGELMCGYHGIRFNGRGACTFVPGLPKPSRFLKLRSYPSIERSGWIWAWFGDPDLADPTAVPGLGLPQLDKVDWQHKPDAFYERINSRYTLLLENLMDLSHLSYLHGDVVQDTTIADRPLDVLELDGRVRAIRHMDASPMGYLEMVLYDAQPGSGIYDWDNISDFLDPALVITGTQVREGAPETFGSYFFAHAVTPETEHSTHYWVHDSRDFRVDDTKIDDVFAQMGKVIPFQDKFALEAIEPNVDKDGFKEVSQPFDKGALLVRRKVQEQLVAEQASRLDRGVPERTPQAAL